MQANPRRWWILAILSLSLLLIGMDNLMVQVALPTIQRQLHTSATELQWIVDAYVLVFAALLFFGGSVADRFGRRRMLLLGLVIFGGALVGAALANGPEALIAFRVVQGIGAATMMPATLAVVTNVFPREERAKAISIWAASAAVGIPLGPIVGGGLLERFGWSSVFWVGVPVVAVAVVAGAVLIPESRAPERERLDLVGAALSVTGLGAIVYGIIEAPTRGWTDSAILSALVAGALLLLAFGLWERRTDRPLLPPEMVHSARFGGTAGAIALVAFGLFGTIYVVSQYLQFVLGYAPLAAGVRLLPIGLMVVAAPLAAAAARGLRPRSLVTGGILLAVAAFAVLSSVGVDDQTRTLIALAIFGIALGLSLPVASDTIIGATWASKLGVGSAAPDAAIQFGGAFGIAVMGSVLASTYGSHIAGAASKLSPAAASAANDSIGAAVAAASHAGAAGPQLLSAARSAFVAGEGDAMLVAAGVGLAGAVLAFVALAPRWSTAAEAPPEQQSRGKRAGRRIGGLRAASRPTQDENTVFGPDIR